MLYFQVQSTSYSAGTIEVFPRIFGPFKDVEAINTYCNEQWPGKPEKVFIFSGAEFTSVANPSDVELRRLLELSQEFVRDNEGYINGHKFNIEELIGKFKETTNASTVS